MQEQIDKNPHKETTQVLLERNLYLESIQVQLENNPQLDSIQISIERKTHMETSPEEANQTVNSCPGNDII